MACKNIFLFSLSLFLVTLCRHQLPRITKEDFSLSFSHFWDWKTQVTIDFLGISFLGRIFFFPLWRRWESEKCTFVSSLFSIDRKKNLWPPKSNHENDLFFFSRKRHRNRFHHHQKVIWICDPSARVTPKKRTTWREKQCWDSDFSETNVGGSEILRKKDEIFASKSSTPVKSGTDESQINRKKLFFFCAGKRERERERERERFFSVSLGFKMH